MALASLQRVKRREKFLLTLAGLVVLLIYRSVPPSAPLDSGLSESVLTLQPIGAAGKPVTLLLFRAINEFGRVFGLTSPGDLIPFTALGLAVLTCILAYFIYRELFAQRYIGWIALALVGLAPATVRAAADGDSRVVALFFVSLAVYAFLKQRWLLWGTFSGLALASDFAAATIVLPFLLWLAWSRRSLNRPGRVLAGASVAVAIALLAYYWVFAQSGGIGKLLENVSQAGRGSVSFTFSLEHAAYLAVYFIACLGLWLYLGEKLPLRRVVTTVIVIGIPFVFLLVLGRESISTEAGGLLWVIALVSVLPLLVADAKKREIVFLLVWLLPMLLLAPLLGGKANGLFSFSVLPLGLLSCRLVDRTLDGEWLDYWWALGLSTGWYYRLGKMASLLLLAATLFQSTRVRG